ncbi:OstA-like protein [Microbacter margulisiae]|uniref:Lipopolysaccharide export system protein LptA n=1 Tax=Microbacter margulisiae TaxID=1350067 RepID=A0A7W5DQR4_9PORP|nr:OstA-like protein [Microbacter margulisiae]MBB3187347.1 lipopolysaccharide export system protein LptA [Microbacter margulisiae]
MNNRLRINTLNKYIVSLLAICLFFTELWAQSPTFIPSLLPTPPRITLEVPKLELPKRFLPAIPDVLPPRIPQPVVRPVLTPSPKDKNLVYLENAQTLSFDQTFNPDVQVLRGDVQFRQGNTFMYCDSAYFYQQENSLDAFGNVKMVQGDTLFLYGDMLYYDGNTQMARMKYNVRMVNKKVVLTTDSLLFDRGKNVGYYTTGGKIVDETNTLTSLIGQYYPSQHYAIFQTYVKLVNPNFVLRSDTLRYDTQTGIANIVGPSTMIYKEKTIIHSKSGWYNTHNDQSQLLDRSVVKNEDGKTLTGDTIFYDKRAGIGQAFHHIVMTDTTQNMRLFGNYGYVNDTKKFGYVTDSAKLVQYEPSDTLFLHADTLYTFKDSIYNQAKAYHHVRFFRRDFQGQCDSLFYSARDSVMYLYGNPIVWSDEQQLTGNEMEAHFKNKELNFVKVLKDAFAAQKFDSIRYNQLSGKELFAYFKERKLYKLFVSGNAESIYFPLNKDSTLIGMNTTQSGFVTMFIKNKKIDKILLTPASNGILYPPDKTPADQMTLKNFIWEANLRPRDENDIFTFRTPAKASNTERHKVTMGSSGK